MGKREHLPGSQYRRNDKPVWTQDGMSEELIQYTIDFWSKRTGQEITAEDAREMIVNVRGFFKTLDQWAREEDMEGVTDDRLAR